MLLVDRIGAAVMRPLDSAFEMGALFVEAIRTAWIERGPADRIIVDQILRQILFTGVEALTMANIQSATKTLSEGLAKKDGSLMQLIEKREFYDDISSAADHLDHILAEIDRKSPDISDSITEARQAIDEANKVIKAIQKSIFIRGYLQERTEDAVLRSEGRIR